MEYAFSLVCREWGFAPKARLSSKDVRASDPRIQAVFAFGAPSRVYRQEAFIDIVLLGLRLSPSFVLGLLTPRHFA